MFATGVKGRLAAKFTARIMGLFEKFEDILTDHNIVV